MLGKKSREEETVGRRESRPGPAASDSVTSIISRQMHIRGDCVVEGAIRIEGRISGNVEAAALEVAESGTVEGDLSAASGPSSRPFVIAGRIDGAVRAKRVDIASSGVVLQGIEADEAHVRGRVEGGIVARERLFLEETAVVEGDVRAKKLALKEGGQVNGTIVMGDRAATGGSGSAGDEASKGTKAVGTGAGSKGSKGAAPHDADEAGDGASGTGDMEDAGEDAASSEEAKEKLAS